MKESPKLDLALLKKYISELEKSLDHCYELRDEFIAEGSKKETSDKFNIEVSKTTGLLAGISHESTLLANDLSKLVQITMESNASNLLLQKILSGSKVGSDKN